MSTIIYFFLGYQFLHIFLWGMFVKAGKPGWHCIIPLINDMTICEINGRKKWHAIWGLLPFFNLFIALIWLSELLDSFEKRGFWEQLGGIAFGFLYFPFVGFNKTDKYHGPSFGKKVKKSFAREWADAIIFAVIAAYVIRTFVIEPYQIPTGSMEGTLLAGDFLFVSKFHYGARIPMTPIAFPFAHHTMPFSKVKAYVEWIKFKYLRLPGLQEIKRNDKVVFNFPAGDTVALEAQDRTYYDLVREQGFEQVQNNYHIIDRPVDKRENYIKRCVAIPGDVVSVVNGEVFIDGKEGYKPYKRQFLYTVEINNPFGQKSLENIDIRNKNSAGFNEGKYMLFLAPWQVEKLKAFPNVTNVSRYDFGAKPGDAYPFSAQYFPWTKDNYGPMKVPNKGYTIKLDSANYILYERNIRIYEGNKLESKPDGFYINDKKSDTYTFKMNYYLMMGDNRDNSADGRFWGLVPEDHIVGKPLFVFLSIEQKGPIKVSLFNRIRFKRFFKPIHGNAIENKNLF